MSAADDGGPRAAADDVAMDGAAQSSEQGLAKVARGFDADPVAPPRKRRHNEAVTDTRAERTERQAKYLKRNDGGVRFGSWRPTKQHRCKAKAWLAMLDNQARSSSGKTGLNFFVPAPDTEEWADHWSWPYLALSQDLGSDGNSGYHGLERFWKANCDQFNDQSHGVNCDWDQLLKHIGAKSMWILMVVSWNMPNGPRKGEDLRMHEMRDCLQILYERDDPNEVPLFVEFAPRILQGLAQNGVQLPGVVAPELEAWRWLRERSAFGRGGRRVTMCRFMASVSACVKNTPMWPVDEFERTYCCLEMDFMGSKKLGRLILKGDAADGAENGERSSSTNGNRPQVDEAVVRSCSQNAMVISQLMLSGQSNFRYCAALRVFGKELIGWHTKQNKETRAADSCRDWIVEQVCFGYMKHVSRFISLLADASALREAEFVLSPFMVTDLGDDIIAEDEFAAFYGQAALNMAAVRMRRNLSLVAGWPKRLFRLLGQTGAADHAAIVAELKRDYDAWRSIVDEGGHSTSLQVLLRRHAFEKTSNDQMIRCLADEGWAPTDRFRELLRSHCTGVLQTQIIEDIIGHQKNNKQNQPKLRYRRPVASMCSALSAEVLTKRHKFATVSADIALESKTETLKSEHFQALREHHSLPFQKIVSTSSDAPFWSPKPENNMVPSADLPVFRQHKDYGDISVVDNADLGMVSSASHQIVLQRVDAQDKDLWFLALAHFHHRSAALLWPCRRRVVPGFPQHAFFDPKLDVKDPALAVISNLGEWVACRFQWRSVAWQLKVFGHTLAGLGAAVRPFLADGPEELFKIACKAGFWELGNLAVQRLAKHQRIEIPPGESLCAVLEKSITAGCSESEALHCMSRRLGGNYIESEVEDALLDVDAAAEVLERLDEDVLEDEQANVKRRAADRKQFRDAFTARRRAVRASAAPAAPVAPAAQKGKGRGRGRGGERGLNTDAPRLPSTIDHKTAKAFAPPGCAVWRGLTRGEWCGHVGQFSRVSVRWSQYGEAGALKHVLLRMWQQYAWREGLEFPACCEFADRLQDPSATIGESS